MTLGSKSDTYATVGRITVLWILLPIILFVVLLFPAFFVWIGWNWLVPYLDAILPYEIPKMPFSAAWGLMLVAMNLRMGGRTDTSDD
jgi:hypothetical protein